MEYTETDYTEDEKKRFTLEELLTAIENSDLNEEVKKTATDRIKNGNLDDGYDLLVNEVSGYVSVRQLSDGGQWNVSIEDIIIYITYSYTYHTGSSHHR